MSTTSTPQLTIKQRLAAGVTAITTGTDLKANLTKLQGDHDLATAEIERLLALVGEHEKTISANAIAITTLTTERDGFKADVTRLTGEVESLPGKVAAGVSERCAELGFPAKEMPKANAPELLNEPKTEAEYANAIESENDPVKKHALFTAYQKKFSPESSDAGRN